MGRIPASDDGLYNYYQQISTKIGAMATPGDAGLSAGQVEGLAAAVSAASTAIAEAETARVASIQATAAKKAAIEALRTAGGSVVTTVDGFVKANDNGAAVYPQTGITPPKTPSPRPAPAVPTLGDKKLLNDGSLGMRVTSAEGSGVAYAFRRQATAPDGTVGGWTAVEMTPVVNSGGKRFRDTAPPAGAASVSYQVRAKLSGDRVSEWSDPVVFFFGANGESVEAPAQAA